MVKVAVCLPASCSTILTMLLICLYLTLILAFIANIYILAAVWLVALSSSVLQLIAYELAVLKGYNPDLPRNLAKAVTTD